MIYHKYPDGSDRPIAFASKTLSDSERNYSEIEREALSIVFGIKKFHQHLYGHKFSLLTVLVPYSVLRRAFQQWQLVDSKDGPYFVCIILYQ